VWLPFYLHPEYPPEGVSREAIYARHPERRGHAARMFAAAGLTYNPPPDVIPSTLFALRVSELARDRGLHDALHDRLMDAYWEEARDIGDPDELRALAVGAGLDGADVDEVLAGDAYADRVYGSTAQAQQIGATGVPAFLLDRRLLVLGAQPQETFERAFVELDRVT
jgi:predicted DsbA family dithiol-disulfide isomerase